MAVVIDVVAVALVLAGVAFLLVGGVGVLRLPDFYSRIHALAKAETLGLLLVVAGLTLYHRLGPATPQLLLVAVFTFMVNPVATHTLSRGAARDGVHLWTRKREVS